MGARYCYCYPQSSLKATRLREGRPPPGPTVYSATTVSKFVEALRVDRSRGAVKGLVHVYHTDRCRVGRPSTRSPASRLAPALVPDTDTAGPATTHRDVKLSLTGATGEMASAKVPTAP